MSTRKKVVKAVASEATPDNFPPIDGTHKELIEAATGKALKPNEWASVRQCLRCMTQGRKIVVVTEKVNEDGKVVVKRKVVVNEGVEPVKTGAEAVSALLRQIKKHKGNAVAAARKLTFEE